ncbi:cysteine desulfurase [Halolamina litorea]|uniref:Aminotransferase class V-fold PLP-dependent enzyme n=1 Tax=Halolamina litorea TaxID=1515593 RepID=A0ABD6BNU4_9EURY|nr:aminotransferase class V-fold PLP-dependent enzyme [Halolamina litorea]
MTPEELRADIPVCESGTYLNTGASGPASQSVVDAVGEFVAYHETEAPVNEGAYPAAFDALDGARETVAGFLNADTEEIALTESTADGIARVAAAIDWEDGDTVVRTDLEHSAGVLPWWNLRERGVDVDVLPTEHGRVDTAALRAAVADARLLCLSSITWNYGTRFPIAEIVDIAHENDCLVLVDAVQTFGQQPLDVRAWGADFVVGAAHKWLLGPWGAGMLYVDRAVAEGLRPAQVGYRSVESPTDDEPAFKAGAMRFEVGTTSPAPYVGAETAIGIVESVGFDTIQARIERLTNRLKDGLGDRLLSPEAYESGLVTFAADEPEATVERLADEDVFVRTLPDPDAVRASVHAFNTEADVDTLLSAL